MEKYQPLSLFGNGDQSESDEVHLTEGPKMTDQTRQKAPRHKKGSTPQPTPKPETTAKEQPAAKQETAPKGKRPYIPQTDVPRHSLEQAVRVARSLIEDFAGSPTAPHQVAMMLGVSPTTKAWEMLCGAAMAYGLTEGGAKADKITLTSLGKRVVDPADEADQAHARAEAALRPRIVGAFYRRFNKSKFPKDKAARLVLGELGVAQERVDEVLEVIKKNGEYAGLTHQTATGLYIAIDTPSLPAEPAPTPEIGREEEAAPETPEAAKPPTRTGEPGKPKSIFIGHGKNHEPLEKIKKMLNTFRIPYKVAIEEPNLARPIPDKVKAVMLECGSAILIFTRDEEFQDKDGSRIWRPSENVVYELGAASYAYENRVVIFKEKGLHFPTNYESIGRIEFEVDTLESKTLELMQELIAFGLLQVTPVSG